MRSLGLIALLFSLIGLAHAQTPGPLPGGGAGTYGPPTFTGKGHFGLGNGAPPVISACGTSPSIVVGTDSAFHFVSGTSASNACTITPAIAWALRPSCVIDTESATKPSFTLSVTGVLILGSVQDATRYYVHCIAQPGGL